MSEHISNGEFDLIVEPTGGGEFQAQAAEVARALSVRDAANLVRNVPEDEKGYSLLSTPGGDQQVWYLTRTGLFRVIAQRQAGRIADPLIQAKVARFQKWAFAVAIPRAMGLAPDVPSEPGSDLVQQYGLPADYDEALDHLVLARKAKREAEEQRAITAAQLVERETQLVVQQPKVDWYDSHASAEGGYLIGGVAASMVLDNLLPDHDCAQRLRVLLERKLYIHHARVRGGKRVWRLTSKGRQCALFLLRDNHYPSNGVDKVGEPTIYINARGKTFFYQLVQELDRDDPIFAAPVAWRIEKKRLKAIADQVQPAHEPEPGTVVSLTERLRRAE